MYSPCNRILCEITTRRHYTSEDILNHKMTYRSINSDVWHRTSCVILQQKMHLELLDQRRDSWIWHHKEYNYDGLLMHVRKWVVTCEGYIIWCINHFQLYMMVTYYWTTKYDKCACSILEWQVWRFNGITNEIFTWKFIVQVIKELLIVFDESFYFSPGEG